MVSVDWDQLKDIGKAIRPLHPSTQQLLSLHNALKKGFLCLPDEFRDDVKIDMLIESIFPNPTKRHADGPINLVYQIQDFDGLVGFMNIQYGYKCDVAFMLWNKQAFNHKVLRDIKRAHRAIMAQLALKRVAFSTPHHLHMKIFKKIGYKVEGRQKFGFKWNNKLYTNHLMRMVRED